MIEIERTTPLSSVQDSGRFGALHYGVGTAGAMDPLALRLGNALLGNHPDDAVIEVPLFPFRVRFHRAGVFALSGGDGQATLNGRPVPPWWVARASAGEVLTLNASRFSARSYLHLPGGVDVPRVLGSRSTQLRGEFGGWQGRGLSAGDRLNACSPDYRGASDFGIPSPRLALQADSLLVPQIRVLPAAEYPLFTPESVQRFWRQQWRITPQSNRYGYRLEGDGLVAKEPIEMRSHGIIPGVIQVTHSGQPIIQMRDAQPSGGYPKLGTVIDADMWLLGQVPVGSQVRFVEVDLARAQEAQQVQQRWLDDLCYQIDRYRRSAG
ncbi:5-oxoprolinase subunit C family protein [Erwinia sorbitola]|uniref:5-oxoprolinase/urea amidolyase family protein n=1 Tax=Erwinia sorbitola TaxID=2681984 RepID=A0A6I6EBH1_9GAMM|nr:biotin-dependent carboxyltransferase family protein [Erwinia sorbitola]MTD26359.1 5-oxoprolinase/urea amidolyase family protein [Erwinia sorbitola]QGU87117.1 5-oxoprolinase/urea amidolyase family protein [Erwinia sorbitola]